MPYRPLNSISLSYLTKVRFHLICLQWLHKTWWSTKKNLRPSFFFSVSSNSKPSQPWLIQISYHLFRQLNWVLNRRHWRMRWTLSSMEETQQIYHRVWIWWTPNLWEWTSNNSSNSTNRLLVLQTLSLRWIRFQVMLSVQISYHTSSYSNQIRISSTSMSKVWHNNSYSNRWFNNKRLRMQCRSTGIHSRRSRPFHLNKLISL